jgi:foldase protein PrsA
MINVLYKLKGYGAFIALTFLFFCMPGCKQKTELPDDLVAQVNDQHLLKTQLQYSVPERLDDELALALKRNLISKWVENEMLYQSALKEGLSLNAKEEFLIEKYKRSLLVQRYLSQKLNKNYKISQKDIENYYRDHKKEFYRREDEVHIIHLLLEQRDNAIFKELRESRELLKLIKKYYFDDKSTSERPNGDLGYVPVKDIPETFVKSLKKMKTGAISKPIKTSHGYHFLQLLDWQKKGSQIDIELVKNKIILRLKRERREKDFERLKNELKEKFQIQTYLSKIQE